jgi:hypothetical protein
MISDILGIKKNGKVKIIPQSNIDKYFKEYEKYQAFLIPVGKYSTVYLPILLKSDKCAHITKVHVEYVITAYCDRDITEVGYDSDMFESDSKLISEDIPVIKLLQLVGSLSQIGSFNVCFRNKYPMYEPVACVRSFKMTQYLEDGTKKNVKIKESDRRETHDQVFTGNDPYMISTVTYAIMNSLDIKFGIQKERICLSPKLDRWTSEFILDCMYAVPLVTSGLITFINSSIVKLLDSENRELHTRGRIRVCTYNPHVSEVNIPQEEPLEIDTISNDVEIFDCYNVDTYDILVHTDIIEACILAGSFIDTQKLLNDIRGMLDTRVMVQIDLAPSDGIRATPAPSDDGMLGQYYSFMLFDNQLEMIGIDSVLATVISEYHDWLIPF